MTQLRAHLIDPFDTEWRVIARADGPRSRVDAVKALRDRWNYGLKDALDAVDAYREEWIKERSGTLPMTVNLGTVPGENPIHRRLDIQKNEDGTFSLTVVTTQHLPNVTSLSELLDTVAELAQSSAGPYG